MHVTGASAADGFSGDMGMGGIDAKTQVTGVVYLFSYHAFIFMVINCLSFSLFPLSLSFLFLLIHLVFHSSFTMFLFITSDILVI